MILSHTYIDQMRLYDQKFKMVYLKWTFRVVIKFPLYILLIKKNILSQTHIC